jgi:hypothetical protein
LGLFFVPGVGEGGAVFSGRVGVVLGFGVAPGCLGLGRLVGLWGLLGVWDWFAALAWCVFVVGVFLMLVSVLWGGVDTAGGGSVVCDGEDGVGNPTPRVVVSGRGVVEVGDGVTVPLTWDDEVTVPLV